jgi:hypothetical protein
MLPCSTSLRRKVRSDTAHALPRLARPCQGRPGHAVPGRASRLTLQFSKDNFRRFKAVNLILFATANFLLGLLWRVWYCGHRDGDASSTDLSPFQRDRKADRLGPSLGPELFGGSQALERDANDDRSRNNKQSLSSAEVQAGRPVRVSAGLVPGVAWHGQAWHGQARRRQGRQGWKTRFTLSGVGGSFCVQLRDTSRAMISTIPINPRMPARARSGSMSASKSAAAKNQEPAPRSFVRTFAGFGRWPQCGQETAEVDISLLHSTHLIRGMDTVLLNVS